jgi:hypothetical protein
MLLLASGAHAAGLEYYGLENILRDDSSVYSTVIMKFLEPVGRLEYQLGFSIYNFTYDNSFPFAECGYYDNAMGSLISCDFTGMSESNDRLTMHFDTRGVVSKKGGDYRLAADYGTGMPSERASVVMKLPEKGILSQSVANESYFPQSGITASDGRRIFVYWESENVSASDSMAYSLLYTMPEARDPVSDYIIVILTLIVVASMLVIAFYLRRGQRGVKADDVIESVLNRDERAVIRVLKRHGGRAGQKVIVRESGFSKAKVSRLVKSLKSRGVVETEPISGRENRVMLTDMGPGNGKRDSDSGDADGNENAEEGFKEGKEAKE